MNSQTRKVFLNFLFKFFVNVGGRYLSLYHLITTQWTYIKVFVYIYCNIKELELVHTCIFRFLFIRSALECIYLCIFLTRINVCVFSMISVREKTIYASFRDITILGRSLPLKSSAKGVQNTILDLSSGLFKVIN